MNEFRNMCDYDILWFDGIENEFCFKNADGQQHTVSLNTPELKRYRGVIPKIFINNDGDIISLHERTIKHNMTTITINGLEYHMCSQMEYDKAFYNTNPDSPNGRVYRILFEVFNNISK